MHAPTTSPPPRSATHSAARLILPIAMACCAPAQADVPPAIADLYSSIQAQEANFPLPTTDLTVTVGTIHVAAVGRRAPGGLPLPADYLDYAVQTYSDGTLVPAPPCNPGHQPQWQPGAGVRALFGATPGPCPARQQNIGAQVSGTNIRNLSLRFAIDTWPTNYPVAPSVTIQLGGQSQTLAPGATEAVFAVGADQSLPLKIDILGAITANGQASSITVAGVLPLKISRVTVGVGAMKIEALPVSIVYAPPVDPQKKNQAGFAQQNSQTNATTVSFTNSQGQGAPATPAFADVGSLVTDMNIVGKALGLVKNPIASGIGAALGIIAGGLGSSTATITQTDTVNTQHALVTGSSLTATQTAFASQGGPGQGDLISYLAGVRALWYAKDGQVQLAILGYDSFVQETASQLVARLAALESQPAGTIDAEARVDAPTLRAILALDPFIGGGAAVPLDPARYAYWNTVQVGGGSESVTAAHQMSSTDTQAQTHVQTFAETDSAGWLSALGIGVTESRTVTTQTTQSSSSQVANGQTVSQTYTLYGDGAHFYASEIYYDRVFGTFAFRDAGAELDARAAVSGTLIGAAGRPLEQTRQVVVGVGGATMRTSSDAKGRFHVRLPAGSTAAAVRSVGVDGGDVVYVQMDP